jgi:hypothetical protein
LDEEGLVATPAQGEGGVVFFHENVGSDVGEAVNHEEVSGEGVGSDQEGCKDQFVVVALDLPNG